MIPHGLLALFPFDVRHRGDDYVRRGAVRLMRETTDSILAVAEGTEVYAVELHAEPGQVVMTCTCPYAEDHGICQHLWATIRIASESRSLDPLVTRAGARAQFYATAAELDVDEIDGMDETQGGAIDDALRARFKDRQTGWHSPARAAPVSIAPFIPPELPKRPSKPSPPWKAFLEEAGAEMRQERLHAPTIGAAPARAWPANRRIIFIVDFDESASEDGVAIALATQTLRRDGEWDAPKGFRAPLATWLSAPELVDRQIVQMLHGATSNQAFNLRHLHATATLPTDGFELPKESFDTALRLIAETGRCRVKVAGELSDVHGWDDGPPWRFAVRVEASSNEHHEIRGVLTRGDERLMLESPVAVQRSGIALVNGLLARVELGDAFPVASRLFGRQIPLGERDIPELLETVFSLPAVPTLELPHGTTVSESQERPIRYLTVTTESHDYAAPVNRLTPRFRYGRLYVDPNAPGEMLFERDTLTMHHRDRVLEQQSLARLDALGARPDPFGWGQHPQTTLNISAAKLAPMMLTLVEEGWHVDVAGSLYRTATDTYAAIRSGIDWFDLQAGARFGDVDVSLSALMEAAARGEMGVALPDGSIGMLPTEWLSKWKALASAGTDDGGTIRFTHSQTALLDALLSSAPEADVDATFETARAELRRFDRIDPVDPPAGFRGTLREYQREGLGWLLFLQRLRLGGCLADDMGLGKTIQVLALLETRRERRAENGPSLVVVPRSLVHNWIREAEQFTPHLRIRDISASDREIGALNTDDVDVLITTYGVLRREAVALSEIEFDYAILDEAQAVKNAATASAKATRLIRARHRLAVTGTPIENRLEELWSLFEFLNPGMLGARAGFGRLVKVARAAGGPEDETAASLLSRALRPVILRRTKQQVAKDLPERTEQTLEVDLDPPQRKYYDGILQRYRASLLDRIDRMGMARSRMHILEALLRLRQAACHPVLVDPAKRALPSAKLDALVPALTEVVSEGHKVLVFSQFTSFLALVREALNAAGITYEYLDGKTRDRQARVDRFQSDPNCPVFLISLKAGGQGLNLTAADYVYLLDPWWNPAVEAQAIDRTHRIGQTRHVIATRLVARGTIEEKILQLQASKRALADAILTEDQGLLSGIGRQELESLLS